MEKVIITVATTGAVTPKEATPHIPLTPREIADDVYACWRAGAAVAHLHMRDENGHGTMDKKRFTETVKLIRERCDIVLNLTTSGALNATDDDRMAHIIELKPELASYDAGTMNWAHAAVFMNAPPFLEKLGKTMIANGIKPEIEVFDSGMLNNALYYIQKGVILTPPHFQFVLGAAGGADGRIESLMYLRSLLPAECTWSAFGIGKHHLPVMLTTVALGGHVRVGLEDNIYYAPKQLATNVEFVARAARIIKEANKEPASPAEARTILGLKKK